jgi:hypothetical protein
VFSIYNNLSDKYDGFEVLAALAMKISIFWDITPYSLMKVNQGLQVHITPVLKVKE